MPAKSVFNEEVVVWLGPEYLGARPYFEVPLRLSTTAWIGAGFFAFIAPFAVLLWKQQRFSAAARELASLCLAVIALAVLFNFRSVRYIVPIVPSLCLLLAIFFSTVSGAAIGASYRSSSVAGFDASRESHTSRDSDLFAATQCLASNGRGKNKA